ncbi:hypothetical protein [Streptomyces sp. SID10815]|uniref:hypothetical protein n=1 Tax=Streptomyces sp. SID10815 TaxID=2706027 RepID=UPI0013C84C52|nr:hypothetical protein [Streptomyces sp. SID10815]NEA52378.1 hypothetical protein [Streptomyces sp. SID10815]
MGMSSEEEARKTIANWATDTMTIRYAVGTSERTVEVLTGGYSLADHDERLDPRNSDGKEFITFPLAGGGEILLRHAAIIAIEHRPVEDETQP